MTRMLIRSSSYQQLDRAIEDQLQQRASANIPILHVHNKVDAVSATDACEPLQGALRVSAQTGQGLDELRDQLLRIAGWDNQTEGLYMARERHLQALAKVQNHLDQAEAVLTQPTPPLDVLAEELRLAQQALGQITGVFDADDLLGVIFSRFCIGK